jgi:predicted DNA-binding transcriptional regulator AlpA
MRAEDLSDLVARARAEDLPRLIGDLEAAKACALARLAMPAPQSPALGGDEARLLAMPEVAARLGITVHQARELGRRGELPTVTVGARTVRVSARVLEQWIGARERTTLRVVQRKA